VSESTERHTPEPSAGQTRAPRSLEGRLKQLTKLGRSLTYAGSMAEILDYAAEQAADLLEAEKAILMLADDDGALRVHASFGVSGEVVSRFRASFDETLVHRLQGLFGTSIGFLGVPLVTQGRVIGLLAVVRKARAEISGEDEWLLSAFADQVSAPLENAQLAAKLERAALLVENARLYEAERTARRDAEAAKGEAEKQRREAEAANLAKSEFIANMSHELRTPLNAIGGYVDLLEMGLRGAVNDAQREDLRRVHHAQRVLVGLVNDVLNFAKIEAGRLEFQIGDVPVHEVLDSVEAFVMPQLAARSLSCVYEPVDPALAVSADREKLQQILLNLLSNAIKYTPSPGTICVSVATDGDAVLFHVSDTGRGIPSEKCDQIFAPFVRVDTGYSRATEGTGLGLAISRDLARTMGGDLTVQSVLGEGSTFTLRLPRGG
jgi:signal transduction histidine kinase